MNFRQGNLRKAIKRDATPRRYLPPRNYDVIDGFKRRAGFNRRKETNALRESYYSLFRAAAASKPLVDELLSNLRARRPCIQSCNLEEILILRSQNPQPSPIRDG